jgi:hypothetical protein
MKNNQVAEAFARGQDAKGGNMFCEGSAIYSYGYHFPIAFRIGYRKYLFNRDGYSNTTGKHKSYVRRALASCELIFASTETIKQAIDTGFAIVIQDKELTKDELFDKLLQYYKGRNVNAIRARARLKEFFDDMDSLEMLSQL